MNGDDKLRMLFASAREFKPDTSRAEYGFEARLMARLRAERSKPALWAVWAWRLIPAFAAFVVLLGIWNYAVPAANGTEADPMAELTSGFEQELFAYFTGE